MRLGAGSYTYGWWVDRERESGRSVLQIALELIEKVRVLGLGVVQICDGVPLMELDEADLRAVGAAAREAGLALEVGTRGVAREHLQTYVEIARTCGAKFLRTMLCDLAGNNTEVDEAIEELCAVEPFCRECGVAIGIENHDAHPTAELVRLIRTVGSDLIGICMDTVNSFAALETPDIVVRNLIPYANNIHLKDFEIARVNRQMGFSITGTALGEGRLDVPAVLGHGKDVSYIIELWTPFCSSMEETVALEDDWAKRSARYLLALCKKEPQR